MEKQFNGKITLHDDRGYHIVKIRNIIRIESSGNYATYFIYAPFVKYEKADGNGCPELRVLLPYSFIKQITVKKTLKECLAEVDVEGYNFMQVHQSHIINLDMLENYDPACNPVLLAQGGVALQINGDKVPVSRARRPDMLQVLQGRGR